MKLAINKALCLALLLLTVAAGASAQETTAATSAQQTTTASAATSDGTRAGEARVPLAQAATALDVSGRDALQGRLRTQTLAGTPEAPVRNTRIVIENHSPLFYNYVAGWATFYDGEGVRCGEGLWKLEAFAPDEKVEVDTPGLRLTCTPVTWRLAATTLLTRTGDVAKPGETATPVDASTPTPASTPLAPTPATATAIPALEINVNGKTIPLQLGNPLEIVVGKERIRLVVQPVP